jgi:GNAT superfamily N-acetyltransferase
VLRVRAFTAADLALGLRLKTQAGWNQTEADWRRAFDLQPDGCFVAELDGAPAGTAAACVFGPVAWVALVLVDAALRGRGVGTALMRHTLDYLERHGVRSVRLDATPLGRPIYEKLGFVAQFELARYQGTMPAGEPVPGVETVVDADYEELLRLDHAVSCTDRRKLLLRLFAERPGATRLVRRGAVEGFVTERVGANAVQIGPCLALSEETGRRLLADVRHRHAGRPVFIDVAADNPAAVRAVAELGLTVQRPLLRMCRGEPVVEDLPRMWASSGPEKG